MSIFYDRVFKVTIYRSDGQPIDAPAPSFLPTSFFENLANGVEITDLDVEFEIEKSVGKQPNKCELKIYNLAEETACFLNSSSAPLTVQIHAGYDGVARLLWVGNVRYASNQLGEVDWEANVILSDGGRAYNHAFASKTYGAGTPRKTILRDVAASMGMRLPRELENDAALAAPISRAEIVDGWSRDSMSRLLAPYGYSWSTQNGQLQILKDTQVRLDGEWVIGGENGSGLIGTPSYGYHSSTSKTKGSKTKALLTFSTFLFPELLPGSLVQLDSESARGPHRIVKVKHQGDTRGRDWTTTCEATPL